MQGTRNESKGKLPLPETLIIWDVCRCVELSASVHWAPVGLYSGDLCDTDNPSLLDTEFGLLDSDSTLQLIFYV